jgi:hypothetical protein
MGLENKQIHANKGRFLSKKKSKTRKSGKVPLQPEVLKKYKKRYCSETGISSCNNFHNPLYDKDTE